MTENDWAGFAFAYNRTGTKLAMFLNRSYGEPHVAIEESLWLVNPRTGRKSLVEEWEDTGLNLSNGVGVVYQHSLLGWLADGKSLVLMTNVESNDGEDLSAVRDDQHMLSIYNTAVKDGEEKDIFNSGEGCLALTWIAPKHR